MIVFLLHNHKNIHYKDENGIGIKDIINFNENITHQIIYDDFITRPKSNSYRFINLLRGSDLILMMNGSFLINKIIYDRNFQPIYDFDQEFDSIIQIDDENYYLIYYLDRMISIVYYNKIKKIIIEKYSIRTTEHNYVYNTLRESQVLISDDSGTYEFDLLNNSKFEYSPVSNNRIQIWRNYLFVFTQFYYCSRISIWKEKNLILTKNFWGNNDYLPSAFLVARDHIFIYYRPLKQLSIYQWTENSIDLINNISDFQYTPNLVNDEIFCYFREKELKLLYLYKKDIDLKRSFDENLEVKTIFDSNIANVLSNDERLFVFDEMEHVHIYEFIKKQIIASQSQDFKDIFFCFK